MELKFKLHLIVVLTLAVLLPGCYAHRKTVEGSKPNADKIEWPDNYRPKDASFFVHNEIDVDAEPQVVWDILMQAEQWPDWYEGASNVKVISNSTGRLDSEAVFSWKTMGQDFNTTTIKEFEPPYRLAWEATKKDIRGYHAWLIIPTDNGCRVVTSETQHGFLTLMQKMFVPNKLRKLHDVWLAELKSLAESTNATSGI